MSSTNSRLPTRSRLFHLEDTNDPDSRVDKSLLTCRDIPQGRVREGLKGVLVQSVVSNLYSLRLVPALKPVPDLLRFREVQGCLDQPESSTMQGRGPYIYPLNEACITIFMENRSHTKPNVRQTVLMVRTKSPTYRTVGNGSYTRTRRSPMGPSRKRSGPVWAHRVRDSSREIGTEAMYDNDTRGFENPGRDGESFDNNGTCPHCKTPILALVARGPSDHVLSPCGCRVTETTARELAGGADRGRCMATDGGQSTDGTYRFPECRYSPEEGHKTDCPRWYDV